MHRCRPTFLYRNRLSSEPPRRQPLLIRTHKCEWPAVSREPSPHRGENLDFLNGSLHHHDQKRPGEDEWIYTSAGIRKNVADSSLMEQDYASLEARWISRELATRAQLRRVDSVTGEATVGRKGGDCAGILIPYFQPGSDRVREFRLRRDHPELEYDASGNLKERNKYLSPPGRSNMLYMVPGTEAKVLQDSALPVIITEGEFKTLALCRAAEHRSPQAPRFLALGLPGVYNWRGTIGKAAGPDGSRTDVKGPIPDLDWIAWSGRKVIIAYDSDVVAKEAVRLARSALAAHLRSRGAVVGFLEWDPKRGKGIDDHLADVGPDAVLDEIAHVDFAGTATSRTASGLRFSSSNIGAGKPPAIRNFRSSVRRKFLLPFRRVRGTLSSISQTPSVCRWKKGSSGCGDFRGGPNSCSSRSRGPSNWSKGISRSAPDWIRAKAYSVRSGLCGARSSPRRQAFRSRNFSTKASVFVNVNRLSSVDL